MVKDGGWMYHKLDGLFIGSKVKKSQKEIGIIKPQSKEGYACEIATEIV